MADAFAPARVLAALEASWSEESSSQWSRGNPARGQCNVTALVLHERYGGEILKTRVGEGEGWHFYNRRKDLRFHRLPVRCAGPL